MTRFEKKAQARGILKTLATLAVNDTAFGRGIRKQAAEPSLLNRLLEIAQGKYSEKAYRALGAGPGGAAAAPLEQEYVAAKAQDRLAQLGAYGAAAGAGGVLGGGLGAGLGALTGKRGRKGRAVGLGAGIGAGAGAVAAPLALHLARLLKERREFAAANPSTATA